MNIQTIVDKSIVEKINNGTLKYRLVNDTNETAKGKVDLRNKTFTNRNNQGEPLRFNDCSLNGADLENSIFDRFDMYNISLKNANLLRTTFNESELISIYMEDCSFSDVQLTNTSIIKSSFINVVMNRSNYLNGSVFSECELNDCKINLTSFRKFDFVNTNINNCILNNSIISQSRLNQISLYDCNINDLLFELSNVSNCYIETGAQITKLTFDTVTLSNCEFSELYFKDIVIDAVTAESVDFSDTVFDYFYITNSKFINSNFNNTTFKNKQPVYDREYIINESINSTTNYALYKDNLNEKDIFIIIDNPDYIFTLKKYVSQPEKIKEWMTSYLSYLTGKAYITYFLETDSIKLKGNEQGLDYTMYDYININEWLAEDPDNIVFKFHNNFYLFTKEILTVLVENPDHIIFGCTEINDTHFVPTKDEIDTTPYFHLKKLFPSGVCHIKDIIAILSEIDKPGHEDTRIYEAREKNPKIELMSTTTLSRINGIGDIESTNDFGDASSTAHCQPGQEEFVYEIVMLVPENNGKKIVDGGKKKIMNKMSKKAIKKTIRKAKKNKKVNKKTIRKIKKENKTKKLKN